MTSGSHAGRVRWFLASLMSDQPSREPELIAARPAKTSIVPAEPVNHWNAAPRPSPATPAAPQQNSPMQQVSRIRQAPLLQVPAPEPSSIAAPAPSGATSLSPQQPQVVVERFPSEEFNWEVVTGPTPFDKIKSFLAVIGVVAVLTQLSKHMKTAG